MTQVPIITIEQVAAIYPHCDPKDHLYIMGIENKLIEKYNAEQATQDQFITADEARALGAGNAEMWITNEWIVCGIGCNYLLNYMGDPVKYRAIRKEVPAAPTCQVRNDDTGVTETMTREAAQKLQAETKDVCDWFDPSNDNCEPFPLEFNASGIYIYKLKAKKQSNLDPAIREGVIALLQELNLIKGIYD